MKRILPILLLVLALAAIVFTLYQNRKHSEAQTAEVASLLEATVIPVRVKAAALDSVREGVAASATFAPYRELMGMAETKGKVLKVYKREGEYVPANGLIAKVDDELIRAEWGVIEANYEKSKRDLERFQSLAKEDAVSGQQLEQIELAYKAAEAKWKATRKHLANTEIRAPFSGILHRNLLQEGMLIGPGAMLYQLVATQKLLLKIKVSEAEIVHVQPGQTVEIQTRAYPQQSFVGTVRNRDVKADIALNYQVEIVLDNPKARPLLAGMYATVRLKTQPRLALLIDRDALIAGLKDPKVYVVEENQAVLKSLRIGAVRGEQVEVLEGLVSGDLVMTSGQGNVYEGAEVTVIRE